jgi:hypothetical protein
MSACDAGDLEVLHERVTRNILVGDEDPTVDPTLKDLTFKVRFL